MLGGNHSYLMCLKELGVSKIEGTKRSSGTSGNEGEEGAAVEYPVEREKQEVEGPRRKGAGWRAIYTKKVLMGGFITS